MSMVIDMSESVLTTGAVGELGRQPVVFGHGRGVLACNQGTDLSIGIADMNDGKKLVFVGLAAKCNCCGLYIAYDDANALREMASGFLRAADDLDSKAGVQ